MATALNFKLSLFYSRLQEPQALAHNALGQDWSQWQRIYLFPPLRLLLNAVVKLWTYQNGALLVLSLDLVGTLVPRLVSSDKHHRPISSFGMSGTGLLNSNRQAQSVWMMLQAWLPKDVTDINRDTLLRFLVYLHSVCNISIRCVVNYRATLALPLQTVFDIDFQDESFSLLSRKSFLQKPPNAKRVPSCSLDVVIETLSSPRVCLDQNDLKDLFLKT